MSPDAARLAGAAGGSSSTLWLGTGALVYLPWLVCSAVLASNLEIVRDLFFTVHSPLGLLLLWPAFPWALVAGGLLWRQARRAGSRRQVRRVALVVAAYPAAAWPFALILRRALGAVFEESALDYYSLLVWPIGRVLGGVWHAV